MTFSPVDGLALPFLSAVRESGVVLVLLSVCVEGNEMILPRQLRRAFQISKPLLILTVNLRSLYSLMQAKFSLPGD